MIGQVFKFSAKKRDQVGRASFTRSSEDKFAAGRVLLAALAPTMLRYYLQVGLFDGLSCGRWTVALDCSEGKYDCSEYTTPCRIWSSYLEDTPNSILLEYATNLPE